MYSEFQIFSLRSSAVFFLVLFYLWFKRKLNYSRTKIQTISHYVTDLVSDLVICTTSILNWQGEKQSFVCDTSICIMQWHSCPSICSRSWQTPVEKDCCPEASPPLSPMCLNFNHPAAVSNIVARVNHKDTEEWIISESDRLCAGICGSWHDFICDSSTSPCKRGLRKGEGAGAAVSVDVGGEINLSESLTSITLRDAGDGGREEGKEGWKTYLDARALKRFSALFETMKEAYTTATCV